MNTVRGKQMKRRFDEEFPSFRPPPPRKKKKKLQVNTSSTTTGII